MNTCVQQDSQLRERHPSDSHARDRHLQGTVSKERWAQHYANRVYRRLVRRQTCLGVSSAYPVRLSRDLARWYDDPLKRTFIEATY